MTRFGSSQRAQGDCQKRAETFKCHDSHDWRVLLEAVFMKWRTTPKKTLEWEFVSAEAN